jgi:L-alanine-DL-glutamate epimerase-like enolase superfamily enzyme
MTLQAVESNIVSYAKVTDGRTAAEVGDRIVWVKVSLTFLPLATPVSDAKVLTGRQKPLTEIAFIFAEIRTRDGHEGIGFGYSKRAGGPGMYAHAKELAPNLLGKDPNDIARIFTDLLWAGASMGRSGMTTQAIAPFDVALWDLKAKRARCRWPSCWARTATACSATTPRAATCTRPWTRC